VTISQFRAEMPPCFAAAERLVSPIGTLHPRWRMPNGETMANRFLKLLSERPFLMADGATGTNLFGMGLMTGDSPELWNFDHPDRIEALHQSFINAGADLFLTNSFGGTRNRLKLHQAQDRVVEINKRYNSNMDPEEFAEVRQKLYHDEYIDRILPVDHVVDHLKAHYGKVRIAVVSGGSREAVEKTLKVLGIYDLVETMVCAGETPNGKPYPDPFLAAAQKLGVDPKDCLVFEDGDPGVRSAIAAGMDWVRIDQLD